MAATANERDRTTTDDKSTVALLLNFDTVVRPGLSLGQLRGAKDTLLTAGQRRLALDQDACVGGNSECQRCGNTTCAEKIEFDRGLVAVGNP